MARPAKTAALDVWMNGERVGHWTVRAKGEHEFAYAEDWLSSQAVRPISLSLPLRPASQPYRGERVAAFFDNLLPDARAIRERMMRRLKAASIRPFDLLTQAGRDCIGALQLLEPGEPPAGYDEIRGETLSANEIERHLKGLGGTPLGQLEEEGFRISLAGVQEKTALLQHRGRWMRPLGATPTTHILKLPIGIAPRGIDLSTSIENEWLCGQVIAAYGLPIASSEMARFGSEKALVVERFDRRLSSDKSWIVRLPQEDLCQATARPPSERYESDGGPGIKEIMNVLAGSTNPGDRETFLRTQIVFWLLCAIDGHAKNFSIHLEQGGAYRLTPLYDVLSAYPIMGTRAGQLSPKKIKMSMAVEGKNRHYHWSEIVRRHWNETARRCGFARDAEKLIEEILAKTPDVIKRAESALPRAFPSKVSEPVLKGLQRAASRLAKQDA